MVVKTQKQPHASAPLGDGETKRDAADKTGMTMNY
jgi:hypothetical protein